MMKSTLSVPAVARFMGLDEAVEGLEDVMARTVDNILACNEQHCAAPFSAVVAEGTRNNSQLMTTCNYVRGQVAVLHHSLLNNEEPAPDFAPVEVVNPGQAELHMWEPLLQELSSAALQAGATKEVCSC